MAVKSQVLFNLSKSFQTFTIYHCSFFHHLLSAKIHGVSSNETLISEIAEKNFREFLGFLIMIHDSELGLLKAVIHLLCLCSILILTMLFNFLNGLLKWKVCFLLRMALRLVVAFHHDFPVRIDIPKYVCRDAVFFHFFECFVQTIIAFGILTGIETFIKTMVCMFRRWHRVIKNKKIY